MTYALIWLACGVGALGWLLFFVARHGHHDSYCTGHDDGFSDGWKACEDDFLQEKKEREALRK